MLTFHEQITKSLLELSDLDRQLLLDSIERCFDDIRRTRGWGMAEVALALGVHYDTLSKLRNGKIAKPSFDLVAGIHLLAEHSLDELLGISAKAARNGQSDQRLTLVENQIKGLMAMLGQVMIQVGIPAETETVAAGASDAPIPADLRQGVLGAAKAGSKKAAAEGRGRNAALRKRTAERDAQQGRTGRRKSA